MSDGAVSAIFDASAWQPVPGFEGLTDVTYHRAVDQGTVRSPSTVPRCATRSGRTRSMSSRAASSTHAWRPTSAACCSPETARRPKDGGWAFCSGGDQRIRGRSGYQYETVPETSGAEDRSRRSIPRGSGGCTSSRCQRLIRFMPKVVICVVPGWAAGGGHTLHVVADLTLASAEHARFKQTDADVAQLRRRLRLGVPRPAGRPEVRPRDLLPRRRVRRRRRRTGWAWSTRSCRTPTSRRVALEWARKINRSRPTAQRMLKYAFNLVDDGLVGQQLFAGEATRLAYATDEAAEGRDAFLEKRAPDWSDFPYFY